MNTQEILNTLLVIGFLIIVTCVVYITYHLVKTLKAVIRLAESLENTTLTFRDKIQTRLLSIVPALLVGLVSRILKRGR